MPIHGDSFTHDYITQIKDSYDETINGIKNIISLKEAYSIELEVKLIVTKEIIDKNLNVIELLEGEGILTEKIDTIIFSGLIQSKVSQINSFNIPNDNDSGKFVSEFINFMDSGNKRVNIKIEDVKLCKLHESIKGEISDNLYPQEKLYEDFYFFDSKYIHGQLINYNKKTSFYKYCVTCSFNEVCGSIMDRYRVLKRNNDRIWQADLE